MYICIYISICVYIYIYIYITPVEKISAADVLCREPLYYDLDSFTIICTKVCVIICKNIRHVS